MYHYTLKVYVIRTPCTHHNYPGGSHYLKKKFALADSYPAGVPYANTTCCVQTH